METLKIGYAEIEGISRLNGYENTAEFLNDLREHFKVDICCDNGDVSMSFKQRIQK